MDDLGEPRIERPQTEPGYGIPRSLQGTLPWSWARERLESSALYWIASAWPDGRPHVMPIWGAWVDEAFWMEGGAQTRRARNLAVNPAAVVHLERGDDVVIVEGLAEPAHELDPALVERLRAGFGKYKVTHQYEPDPKGWEDGGIWRVRPAVAFGWSDFPRDATRWRFGRSNG